LAQQTLTATQPVTEKREFTVAGEYIYNRSSPVRWIISHLWRHKFFLGYFFLALTLANLLSSSIPRLTGRAFDTVLQTNPDLGRLTTIALTILGCVLLRGLLDLSGNLMVEVMGQRLERDARDELYISLLGKSQTFHNRQRIGDIMARATNDVRQLNPMVNPGISLIFDSMMALIIPIIFIAFIRIELLLAPLLFTAVFYFALRHYMQQLNPIAWQMRMQFGEVNAGLAESVNGIEVVKSAAQEPQEMAKFLNNAGRFRDFFVENGRIQARYIPTLLLATATAFAFLHGLWLHWQGQIQVGDLIAYMGLMSLLRFPTFISIFTFSLVQMGLASAERILQLIQTETELDENETGHSQPMRGEIIFDNVTFSFGGKPLLKNISFRAAPGQTIAIVGQTGSGKSTLTRLVNRTYDVESGRILVDGIDVRHWSLASLRSQISTIEQDVFLFSRTIAENIAFGLQQATQEAIERAAHEAQAHDFITTFQDGYHTVVGERGVTLSGGQRQRLAIARALLTDPRILILDDATSAIDSATEDAIQKAIRRVLEGRTTLLITHRLSQIRWADKILVIEQGQLIDQGTHHELLTRCDLYRRIFSRYDIALPAEEKLEIGD
jgi:ATP-binding cassette subfamily B protein